MLEIFQFVVGTSKSGWKSSDFDNFILVSLFWYDWSYVNNKIHLMWNELDSNPTWDVCGMYSHSHEK